MNMTISPSPAFHSTGEQHRALRNTLALIMAGGRGTRLEGLTAAHSKPAVPFGGKFRIIDFALSNCINSGIRRIGVLTQYKAHSLLRHLQMGWNFLRGDLGEFVELVPAQQRIKENSWYAGTADAVYQNLDIIRAHAPSHVLILAGDHIYKMDYARMLAQHIASGAQLTIGCIDVPVAEARAFGVMDVDEEGRIRAFAEKPNAPRTLPGRPDTALASMGIYVFDTLFLLEELSRDAAREDSDHDFGKNIIPDAIGANRVFAFPFTDECRHEPAYWRDVGTVDAYWRANLELTVQRPPLDLYDPEWPIWTHQAQLPPARFIAGYDGMRGTTDEALVAGGCVISGAEVRRCSRARRWIPAPASSNPWCCRAHASVTVAGCAERSLRKTAKFRKAP
jgi:glucose-1-phosphate adenylyltransferase